MAALNDPVRIGSSATLIPNFVPTTRPTTPCSTPGAGSDCRSNRPGFRRLLCLKRLASCGWRSLTACGPRRVVPTRVRWHAERNRVCAGPRPAVSWNLRGLSVHVDRVRPQRAGHSDATTAEEDPSAKNIVIYPVSCALPNRAPDAPKLSGVVPEIRLRAGSFLASCYGGQEVVAEEFFCNYEVNPEFEWAAMEAGFPVVARGEHGECRAIESPTHKFFVATLFQPDNNLAPRPSPSARPGLRPGRSRLSPQASRRLHPRVIISRKNPVLQRRNP